MGPHTNAGKQNRLVERGASYSSESNGQQSATGEMSTVRGVTTGRVEGGDRPGGTVNDSGRVCFGPQNQLRHKGSASARNFE